MEVVAATGNKDKLEEFRRILEPLGVKVISPAQLGLSLEVEETGQTFAQNAHLKAKAYFEATGLPALADDSGLCVDALDGRPGVYSARYHGEETPYGEKFTALFAELKDVPEQERTGQFVCAICCILGEDRTVTVEECCQGLIGYEPKGDNGFGYDPIFYVDGRTMAQRSDPEKDAVSHRGKALRSFARAMKARL